MKLCDIVESILLNDKNCEISQKDIIETVELLIKEEYCNEDKTLFTIKKLIDKEVEYERDLSNPF